MEKVLSTSWPKKAACQSSTSGQRSGRRLTKAKAKLTRPANTRSWIWLRLCARAVTCQAHSDTSSEDEYFGGYASEPSTLRASVNRMRQLRNTGSLSLSENEYETDTDDSDNDEPKKVVPPARGKIGESKEV